MAVIDFHSHILPGIDDGSKDLDTSIKMLHVSAKQGVDIMVATPHFYASRHSVEEFLKRRERAYEQLCQARADRIPKIRRGAEVAFFRGMSRADKLGELLIEGTNLLLLEMPFEPWTDAIFDEVKKIAKEGRYQIILAHLERYMGISVNRKRFHELFALPVFIQINAESLLEWRKRRALLKMFAAGQAHFLGSDCHGIHHRTPNLAEGRAVLKKKLGEDFLIKMDKNGSDLLRGKGEADV